jgi:hypothetical protein
MSKENRTIVDSLTTIGRAGAVAALLVLAACNGSGGGNGIGSEHPYLAIPPPANLTASTIAVPNVPVASPAPIWSFDIGLVDDSTGLYYLADKTNSGIDVFDAKANTYLKTITGGFIGNTGTSSSSGPNGLILIDSTKMYAMDGNNTMKVVNLTSGTVTKTVPLGGKKRGDEGSYDPDDHIVMIASDADSPPFLTFINTTTDTVINKVSYPQATNGMEDSLYIPSMHAFLQAIPATKTNKNGEIDVIDPVSEQVKAIYPISIACGPTGLALGPNLALLVACGQPGSTLVIGAATGAVLAQINQAGGGDESAYDATTNRFYVANSNNTADGTKAGAPAPVVTVIDAGTLFFVQNIPGEVHAHSIASFNGKVFEPRPSLGVSVFQ